MRQQNSKPAIISANGCGCLVLLMCIGVMTAIALPSFLTMATKAKQSEAIQYVSSMNKGQQAFYAEKSALSNSIKSAFSNSIPNLGLGIETETINYKYSTHTTKQAVFNYGISKHQTIASYVGGVFVVPDKNGSILTSILCEADDRGTIEPAKPIYQNGKVICGQGTTEVTK